MINPTDYALSKLRTLDGEVTSDIIKDLIRDHETDRLRMYGLYERYKTKRLPIQGRTFDDPNKINRKLNNDYFSEIVDTKVGYFAGNPIAYQVDKLPFKVNDQLNEAAYEAQMSILDNWKMDNNVEDLDSETAKMAAICGTAARLCYINSNGEPRTININPWECIFIDDSSTGEPQYAMRYYKMHVPNGGKWNTIWKVEWYDQNSVTFYIEDAKGAFALDPTESVNPLINVFDGIPLVEFPNNEERMGDGECVLELIDGYDRTLSDVNSEIEQFRLAYMIFFGVEPDEDVIQQAKRTGAFFFENPQGGEKAEFLTKNLNDAVIENHLNRLDNNIYKFSKTPNFQDEGFAGSQSGEARKYKMLPFESKCITTERKFTSSLRAQFRLLTSIWRDKYSAKFTWRDIYMEFKRNFPLDLEHEGDSTMKLKGLISERTRLSLLSFVDDVDHEIRLMEQEYQPLDLDDVVIEDEDDEEN